MQLVYLNVAHAAAYAAFGLLWLHAARLRRRSARALPAMLSDASRALGDSAPPLCVVLPVKGAHAQSAANWRAQCCSHGYAGPVSFLFVVQEEEDEAYSLVKQLQASGSLPTENVRVLVAGLAVGTSQKLHNLIHAVERIGEQSELVLMLDDDMLLAPGEGGAEKEGLRGSERVRGGLLVRSPHLADPLEQRRRAGGARASVPDTVRDSCWDASLQAPSTCLRTSCSRTRTRSPPRASRATRRAAGRCSRTRRACTASSSRSPWRAARGRTRGAAAA